MLSSLFLSFWFHSNHCRSTSVLSFSFCHSCNRSRFLRYILLLLVLCVFFCCATRKFTFSMGFHFYLYFLPLYLPPHPSILAFFPVRFSSNFIIIARILNRHHQPFAISHFLRKLIYFDSQSELHCKKTFIKKTREKQIIDRHIIVALMRNMILSNDGNLKK